MRLDAGVTMRDPGAARGCGNTGWGRGPLFVLLRIFLAHAPSSREHGKAINMDCGLAVVPHLRTGVPRKPLGQTASFMNFQRRLSSLFFHYSWTGAWTSGEGKAVGLRLLLPLSSINKSLNWGPWPSVFTQDFFPT